MGPVDHDLVGVREALGCGEGGAGVADRGVVAEEGADPAHRTGVGVGAEHQQPGRRRPGLEEHTQGLRLARHTGVGHVRTHGGAVPVEHAAGVGEYGDPAPRQG